MSDDKTEVTTEYIAKGWRLGNEQLKIIKGPGKLMGEDDKKKLAALEQLFAETELKRKTGKY